MKPGHEPRGASAGNTGSRTIEAIRFPPRSGADPRRLGRGRGRIPADEPRGSDFRRSRLLRPSATWRPPRVRARGPSASCAAPQAAGLVNRASARTSEGMVWNGEALAHGPTPAVPGSSAPGPRPGARPARTIDCPGRRRAVIPIAQAVPPSASMAFRPKPRRRPGSALRGSCETTSAGGNCPRRCACVHIRPREWPTADAIGLDASAHWPQPHCGPSWGGRRRARSLRTGLRRARRLYGPAVDRTYAAAIPVADSDEPDPSCAPAASRPPRRASGQCATAPRPCAQHPPATPGDAQSPDQRQGYVAEGRRSPTNTADGLSSRRLRPGATSHDRSGLEAAFAGAVVARTGPRPPRIRGPPTRGRSTIRPPVGWTFGMPDRSVGHIEPAAHFSPGGRPMSDRDHDDVRPSVRAPLLVLVGRAGWPWFRA